MRIHHISFIHAFEGIKNGVSTQPNFVIHLILSAFAIGLGWILDISLTEWCIILLLISFGLSLELVNTSIEYAVDLITDKYHLLAKYSKDTAAGAMLVHAVMSVIIALCIFLPKIIALFKSL